MPNRIIRDGFLDSEAIDALTPAAECLFHRLLLAADDAGRLDGRPSMVLSRCYPIKRQMRAQAAEDQNRIRPAPAAPGNAAVAP